MSFQTIKKENYAVETNTNPVAQSVNMECPIIRVYEAYSQSYRHGDNAQYVYRDKILKELSFMRVEFDLQVAHKFATSWIMSDQQYRPTPKQWIAHLTIENAKKAQQAMNFSKYEPKNQKTIDVPKQDYDRIFEQLKKENAMIKDKHRNTTFTKHVVIARYLSEMEVKHE